MLEGLTGKLSDVLRQVAGRAHITEKNIQDAVREIKVALLEADVNLRVVRRFVNRASEDAQGDRVLKAVSPADQFTKIVYDRMVQLLGSERAELQLKGPDALSVVLLMGLQGSGKTTTAAKLARHLVGMGRRPMLAAADLARPAAIEQLRVLAATAEVPVYAEEDASDPVAVARAALDQARREAVDTLIVDTAGRLQLDDALMAELKDVAAAVGSAESILVLDAMSGQSAADVAKQFDAQIGLTALVLSKLDSDARGGAALSVREISGKPIKFAGVGEALSDLEPFYPDRMASRILGMGDVVSLVEQVQETFDEEEAARLVDKMRRATFTIEDYLEQLAQLRKMGSISSIIEKLPGMAAALENDAAKPDEAAMRREEAIMLSMTPAERRNPRILGPSRRKRVARSSGTSVFAVNQLLKKFDKMASTMRKMTRGARPAAPVGVPGPGR
ncbi:MAG: signal recognition particle protein [Dehalococcoidia bacterium]|nr:signal recognition particle protein [Dehalococcoidia bacterium]